MKLWDNAFDTTASALAEEFNRSISFDKRLYTYDIAGTLAHVKMLKKQHIIPEDEADEILFALNELLSDIQSGEVIIDESYEDIHSYVELYLTEKIGDSAKKMHTGRSRNDQVALDMRLFVIQETRRLKSGLDELITAMIAKASDATEDIMPAFTHLRKAQPTTFAHYICAYIEMFLRDLKRIAAIEEDCLEAMPLGSGACCGNTYDIDREYVAELLGFSDVTHNSIDGVSDRDYMLDMLYALSMMMMHISRYCEELILFTSEQYAFFTIGNAFCSGSSMMPQKKNPDMAELLRGKTGRVYGALIQMLTTMKAQPLSYNKDMQEDKEFFFDAIDTANKCLKIFTAMFESVTLNKETAYRAARDSYITAVDAADYLVKKGLPFRDAYKKAAGLVNYCIDNNKYFHELTAEELHQAGGFDKKLLKAITVEHSIKQRRQTGGPAPEAVKKSLAHYKAQLNKILSQN